MSGVRIIAIRAGSVDVVVSRAGGGEVSLGPDNGGDNGDGTAGDARAVHVLRSWDGARLRVWAENDSCRQLRIAAPRGTDISVETSSGRVTVDGTVGGTCNVRTISGGIRIRRVQSRLSVTSVSGSIELDAAEGSVNAGTVSGTIRAKALKLIADSSFSSVSGDIDVELDPDVESLSYDLKSVSGSITVGSLRAERGLRMGFYGPLVRGHTTSGALSFR